MGPQRVPPSNPSRLGRWAAVLRRRSWSTPRLGARTPPALLRLRCAPRRRSRARPGRSPTQRSPRPARTPPHARSPSGILHHDVVRDHILSFYLTVDLGRYSKLANPRSPFTSGRFRLLVLGHVMYPTHCFRLMIQPFVAARSPPNLAACPLERAPNKCGQHPAGGPRYRVARLGPQRGLTVAPRGEQGTASDPLAVNQNFDSAEFLVGLGRYGSFSNPYPPLHV